MDNLYVLTELIQPLTTAVCFGIGWGVRRIFKRLDSNRTEMLNFREEWRADISAMRAELQDCVRKDLCEACRAEIDNRLSEVSRRIDMIVPVYINDRAKMRDVRDSMTPEEQAEHLKSCVFREGHDGGSDNR